MSNPKHSRDCPRCNTPRYRRPSGVVDCVNDCRERGLISLETPILLRSKISQSSKTALGQHGADGMPPLRGPAAPQPTKVAHQPSASNDRDTRIVARMTELATERDAYAAELERVKQQLSEHVEALRLTREHELQLAEQRDDALEEAQ